MFAGIGGASACAGTAKAGRGRSAASAGNAGKPWCLSQSRRSSCQAEREKILRAATTERLSLRGIGRTFGPCYRTLRRWAGKKRAEALPPLHETLLPARKGDVLELDELWSLPWQQKRGRVLAVDCALPAHPPDRGLHAWRSLGRKCLVAAQVPAAGLSLSCHTQ
jgi:hypothetical protein